jgi:fucose 4-O-acetylase-like acetyltransferase
VLKFLLALHLVLAVFVIGPLVWAATTAGRGVRKGDGAATASSARILRIYAYVSVLVVAVGFGLMSQKDKPSGLRRYADYAPAPKSQRIADFGDTWIWLSLVLWALAVALVLLVIVPTLDRATKLIAAEESVVTLTARVAAAGGVVGLLFVAIVVLMAYKPGS